jgi:anthranilate phosphoribosyltransferase
MLIRDYITQLQSGLSLDSNSASNLMNLILDPNLDAVEVSALLVALNSRLPSTIELRAYRDVLYSKAETLDFKQFQPIDVCGTGGDGKDTFNISTLAAFLLAAAGVKVAKHGNYAASSKCGSSNILEKIGIKFPTKAEEIESLLDQVNMVYLHAPLFHPALKQIAPVRKKLGMRTIFNLLGPLLNPIKNTISFCGVAEYQLLALYAGYFQQEKKLFMLAHTLTGYDELSLTAETKLIYNNQESNKLLQRLVSAQNFGQEQILPEALTSMSELDSSASQFMEILAGKGTKAQTAVVSANAAAAYHLLNQNLSFEEAFLTMEDLLLSGKALNVYNKYIKLAKG